jgi:hypothetical protein
MSVLHTLRKPHRSPSPLQAGAGSVGHPSRPGSLPGAVPRLRLELSGAPRHGPRLPRCLPSSSNASAHVHVGEGYHVPAETEALPAKHIST